MTPARARIFFTRRLLSVAFGLSSLPGQLTRKRTGIALYGALIYNLPVEPVKQRVPPPGTELEREEAPCQTSGTTPVCTSLERLGGCCSVTTPASSPARSC